MARAKKVRCESCLKMFDEYEVHSFNQDWLCLACVKHHAERLAKENEEANKKPYERIRGVDGGKKWFAIAVHGNDVRVRQNIIRKFTDLGAKHQLGRIVIPKVPEARFTMNRYEVIDQNDKVIGHVSALTDSEALTQAIGKYESNKTMKGVFKFEPNPGVLASVETVKAKGKVSHYEAKDAEGKLIGKITAKTIKQAREIAQKLYGEKKPDSNPRSRPKVAPGTQVVEVRQIKEGGSVKIEKKRAMPGYLLVQMIDDDSVFATLKSVSGVASLLPFNEPMKWEDIEDGEPVPLPSPINTGAVKTLLKEIPNRLPHFELNVGDYAEVVAGPFIGQKAFIEKINPKRNEALMLLTVVGMKSLTALPLDNLRPAIAPETATTKRR